MPKAPPVLFKDSAFLPTGTVFSQICSHPSVIFLHAPGVATLAEGAGKRPLLPDATPRPAECASVLCGKYSSTLRKVRYGIPQGILPPCPPFCPGNIILWNNNASGNPTFSPESVRPKQKKNIFVQQHLSIVYKKGGYHEEIILLALPYPVPQLGTDRRRKFPRDSACGRKPLGGLADGRTAEERFPAHHHGNIGTSRL